jgi:hypothetical protein
MDKERLTTGKLEDAFKGEWVIGKKIEKRFNNKLPSFFRTKTREMMVLSDI